MNFPIKIYTQTPSNKVEDYYGYVSDLARHTEEFNYKGLLVKYSTKGYDPLMVTNLVLQQTRSLQPLIAVQPDTLPPYTLAKMIKTIAMMYDRQVGLNLISGTDKRANEETQVASNRNKSNPYLHLGEYVSATVDLLKADASTSFIGDFYSYSNMEPESLPDSRLLPDHYVSGTSIEGLEAASRVDSGFLTIPGPIEAYKNRFLTHPDFATIQNKGICFSIITRPTSEEAWEAANNYFPQSRANTIRTALKRSSNIHWVRELAEYAVNKETYDDVFWMGAFRSDKIMGGRPALYPYLVGNYEEVTSYLQKYVDCGVNTLILNEPFTRQEFEHRDQIFKQLKTPNLAIH